MHRNQVLRRNHVLRWLAVGTAAGAVLMTTACGGKQVTFTPAADSSAIGAPAGGAASTSSSAPAPTAFTTPPDVVVTTQGSSICIRSKNNGSVACVSKQGRAVVNGLVIVDGRIVGRADGNGSVSVGDGSVVSGDNVPPVPTSGHVALTGAVRWSGTASGTCRHTGEVRHAEVGVGSGTLTIDAVGTGVVRIELTSGGTSYSGDWVGDSGLVTLTATSLTVHAAPLGRDAQQVQVDGTLNC